MALTQAVISFDISDYAGADFDARRTKVYATNNVVGGAVIDTDGNKVYLGSGNATIAADGTGSISVPIPGTGSNPASWQTTIHVDYPDRNTARGRTTRSFGPFTTTASANLADLVPEQEVPAEYVTLVTAQLDAKVTEAETAATSAAASAAQAKSVAEIDTSDALVTTLVNDPASTTKAALSATFAPRDASFAPRQIINAPRVSSVVTQFQAGHGWTVSGAATNDANYTGAFAKGSQCVRQISDTAATLTTLSKSGLALDFTNHSPRLTFRVDNPQDMTELYLYLTDAGGTWFWRVDFDSLANRRFVPGEWVSITLPFSSATVLSGTPARTNITSSNIRFRGRTGVAVTAYFQALEMVPAQALYPNGVISVTFDDGHDSIYNYGRARLDQYGYGATNFLIADRVGQANFLTLSQCKQLEQVNNWENAAHAFTLANHDARLTSLTGAALDEELYRLKEFMVDNDFRGRDLLAYPGARWNAEVKQVTGRYFAYGRHLSAINNVQAETIPPSDRLVAQAVSDTSSHASGLSVANTKAYIDRVKAQKGWGVLTFHQLVTGTPANAIQCSVTDYNSVIDYLNSTGVAVRTVSEVLRGVA